MRAIELTVEPLDQIFSYWMEGKTLLHFNASLLGRLQRASPSSFERFTIPLTPEIYDLCMTHRGIEEPKVARLKGKDLREPGLIVLWAGDRMDQGIPDYTVVDGHHRIVRCYRGGIRTMDFWACLPAVWTQILMPSTPEIDKLIACELPPPTTDGTTILHSVTRSNT